MTEINIEDLDRNATRYVSVVLMGVLYFPVGMLSDCDYHQEFAERLNFCPNCGVRLREEL